MQISKEQYKALVKAIIANLKRLELELAAYKMTINALKHVAPNLDFDQVLSRCRELPELREKLEKKYGEYQKKEFERIDREEETQELLEFLQEWNSDEPVN